GTQLRWRPLPVGAAVVQNPGGLRTRGLEGLEDCGNPARRVFQQYEKETNGHDLLDDLDREAAEVVALEHPDRGRPADLDRAQEQECRTHQIAHRREPEALRALDGVDESIEQLRVRIQRIAQGRTCANDERNEPHPTAAAVEAFQL